MRASRHKPEQIINILREAETSTEPLAELCRKHSISEETFYRWRRRFGGLDLSEARRVRDLAAENARLKKLLAERDLELDALKLWVEKKR
jgi:putative transposase